MEQDAGRGKDGMTKEMGTEYFLERTKVVISPAPTVFFCFFITLEPRVE